MMKIADNGTPTDVGYKMEDHALTAVPVDERKSGLLLMTNTAGLVCTLLQVAIASSIAAVAGVKLAIIAGILMAIVGTLFAWLVAHVAYVSGMSSTVLTRNYGLGNKGSILAAFIFSFMIIGMLALENAVLYYGTLFAFGWAPTLTNAIVIYLLFTIAWIVLTLFGMNLVIWTSSILLLAFIVMAGALAFITVQHSPLTFFEILNVPAAANNVGGWVGFGTALSMLAGSVGALALVDADHARYARSTGGVGLLAAGGYFMMDVVVVVLGAIIIGGSGDTVASYLSIHASLASAQPGQNLEEKVSWLLMNNTGAYFVILFGIMGFILLYVAQIKSQVLNTYSGSLSVTNLLQIVSGRNISRVWAVVLCNIVGLAFVAAGILNVVVGFLGILGAATFSLCAVIVADYYVIRRRKLLDDSTSQGENVNWPGVISVVAGITMGIISERTGIFPLGFVVGTIVSFGLYVMLRKRPAQM